MSMCSPKTSNTLSCSFVHSSLSSPHQTGENILKYCTARTYSGIQKWSQTNKHQSTHQHICGVKVVLACHIGLQPLRHLLDAFDFIQQLEDVLVLNALYPQLPQLVPFAVEQHLTRQEVFFHLQQKSKLKSRQERYNTSPQGAFLQHRRL